MVQTVSNIHITMTVTGYIIGVVELSLSTPLTTKHVGVAQVSVEDLDAMAVSVSDEHFTRGGVDCAVPTTVICSIESSANVLLYEQPSNAGTEEWMEPKQP